MRSSRVRGIFAGSLLLARYGPAAAHPFRVFAALETAIALWATLLVSVMPLVGRIYAATDDGGTSSLLLRGARLLRPSRLLLVMFGATVREGERPPILRLRRRMPVIPQCADHPMRCNTCELKV